MKLKEKNQAIELRKKGKSYNEILNNIKVSKGTLSLWLRDIELTEQQKAILLIGRQKSRYLGAKKRQQQRIDRTEKILREAQIEVKALCNNSFFVSGLMLYWAEGSKSPVEQVRFANSDPIMIKLMMKWFRNACKVPEEKFRIGIHIHNLHCRKDVEKHWSDITGIPLKRFVKTYVKTTSLGHRKNKLYNGVCTIRINNVDLFRRIHGWRLGIVENFN